MSRKAENCSRSYCFTLNNYTEQEYEDLVGLFNSGGCQYLIIGKEVAPETGTEHLQAFIYFKNAKSFSAAKAVLGHRAHLEIAKGTIDQNYRYCSKGGNFATWGTRPMSQVEKGEANKQRYEAAWALAKSGDFEKIDGDIRVNSYRTLKEIHKDYMPRVDDASDVTGYWIFGEAGVGKSRTARDRFPVFYPKLANKWWDGYQGEEAVILDDLDPDNAKYIAGHLKLWSDRYSFLAETKGGAKRIRPKYFCVTSQYSIAECFSDEKVVAALSRRFRQERVFQYIACQSWLPEVLDDPVVCDNNVGTDNLDNESSFLACLDDVEPVGDVEDACSSELSESEESERSSFNKRRRVLFGESDDESD